MRIVFATGNQNKMREIHEIMDDLGMEIVSMKEAGISADIVEDGKTFEENACIKASAIQKLAGGIVLADDSGLEVDYLGGAPGIYSARYMGEDTSYEIKNRNIIERLAGAKGQERSARFQCNIAAVLPDGSTRTTRGTIEGYIGWEPAGANGFGYDPIFYVDEYGCSTAQLSPEEKNKVSHRGNALRAMREELRRS